MLNQNLKSWVTIKSESSEAILKFLSGVLTLSNSLHFLQLQTKEKTLVMIHNMNQQDPISALKAPLISNVENGTEQIQRSYSKDEVLAELKKQLRLAGPLVVVSFLQYSLLTISVMFIGHLGELALSSSSMATSFSGVTGFSLMVYMNS